jgi:hypothetical protein
MSAEIIDWPSTGGDEPEELCPWCECMPDQPHQLDCPLYAPCFDDLSFCDSCGHSYATNCPCSEGEDK